MFVIFCCYSFGYAEQFPAIPPIMQHFVNLTKPNVALAIDNSLTTSIELPRDLKNYTKPTPRRLDIFKDAAMQITSKYYNEFNWTISVIADGQRDKHWKKNPDPKGSGYDVLPVVADCTVAYGTEGRWYCGNFDSWHPRHTYNSIATTTLWASTFGKNYKNLIPGTTYNYYFPYNNGWIMYKDQEYGLGTEEILPQTAIWGYDNEPRTSDVEWPRWWAGKQILIPHSDTSKRVEEDKGKNQNCASYFAKEPTEKVVFSADNYPSHYCLIQQQIKEITPRGPQYLGYLYPNLVDYMAEQIKYRCQETFIIVLTDGDDLSDIFNTPAAKKYAFNDAKHGTDAEGKSFDGVDFPNQFIKSYAAGFDFNFLYARAFDQFAKNGGGSATLAYKPDDMMKILEGFVREMRPSNVFMTSLPAVSSAADKFGNYLTGHVLTNPNNWSSGIKFKIKEDKPSNKDKKEFHIKYLSDYAVVFANTNKGLINFSDADEVQNTKLTNIDFDLAATKNVTNFVSWLIGSNIPDADLGFRERSFTINDEKRFMGDVLDSGFVMVGETNEKISAPEYLSLGSNDGMLKIFKANPQFGDYLEGEDQEKIKLKADGTPITDQDGIPLTYGACYLKNSDGSFVLDTKGKKTPTIIQLNGYCQALYDTNVYIYTFSYIPGQAIKESGKTILNTLKNRADPNYGFDVKDSPEHQYNVNGGIFYRTTDKGQTFIVGNLGQGGRATYALNIGGINQITGDKVGLDAPKTNWKQSIPLWDTSSRNFGNAMEGSQNMGYTIGTPSVARFALKRDAEGKPDFKGDIRYVAAVSSGYDSSQAGPTLYLYDALGANVAVDKNIATTTGPGKLIKTITYTEGSGLMNSLSSPTLVDLNFDGIIDIAYAGDRNGNLYRFDFRGRTVDDWSVHLLYKGSSDKPIVSAPAFSNFNKTQVVIFGTGSQLFESDFYPLKEQSIYGIYDDFSNKTISQNLLIQQTLSPYGSVTNKRLITNNKIKEESEGWFVNFTGGYGESVTASPQVYNGTVFFTTNIIQNKEKMPEGAICFRPLIGPTSWIMQLNAKTGGTLSDDDTHIKDFTQGGGTNLAGSEMADVTLSQIVITLKNMSYAMTTNGVAISGNMRDFDLIPNQTNPLLQDLIDNRCDEDAFMTTNDNNYELSKCVRTEIQGTPRRIYLHKRF